MQTYLCEYFYYNRVGKKKHRTEASTFRIVFETLKHDSVGLFHLLKSGEGQIAVALLTTQAWLKSTASSKTYLHIKPGLNANMGQSCKRMVVLLDLPTKCL